MRMIKKILVVVAVLIASSLSAFAVDKSQIMIQNVGNESRVEFNRSLESVDMGSLFAQMFEDTGIMLTSFREISAESGDAEIMEDFIDCACESYNNNDVFFGMAINELDLINSEMDGWFAMIHVNEKDVLCSVYYFDAKF